MIISKRTRYLSIGIMMVFATLLMGSSSNIKVIKDPKPNMKESKLIRLVKVKEIGPEVGKDQYIFSPISFAVDDSENLFVFDRMQSKIVHLNAQGKFVKSFGGFGEGPGEFGGKGRYYLAFLLLNSDNLIYVNDTRKFKIVVFNRDGKYMKEIKYRDMLFNYTLDEKGNLIFYDTKDGVLEIFNNKGEIYYSYPIERKKIQYLFRDTSELKRSKRARPRPRKSPFHLNPGEINTRMTVDGKLLVYFPKSATLLVIKEKKLLKEIKVWPAEALKLFKVAIENDEKVGKSLFGNYFLDIDDPNILYFQFVIRKNNINRLYRVNLRGQLLSVYTVGEIEEGGYPWINFEKNGKFYSIYDDKILVFKEERK